MPYPLPINPSDGRFFPLGHQEWRAFPRMSEAWMFHGVAIIEYCLFCFVLFKAMSMRGVNNVSVFLFLATLPPIVVAFSMIVAPERNILVLFALWFLFYSISKQNNDIIFGVLSLICATAALFFKEPTFLFFAGFSVIQLWAGRSTKGDVISFAKNNWREIGLAISAIAFILAYQYYVKLSVITTDNAYHGSNVAIDKIIPAIKEWTLTEPLILPLLVLGLALTIVGMWTKKESGLELFGIWLGSFFYFSVLSLMKLVSKYYAALPLLGFAIYSCIVLKNLGWLRRLNILFYALAAASTLFWLPVIIRKHDYAHRSVEVVDKILELFPATVTDQPTAVLVRDGDGWQAQMLIIYADHIRKANIQFYCDYQMMWGSPVFYYDDGVAICRPNEGQVAGRVTVDLDQSNEEGMSARLFVDGKEVWRYISIWERVVPFFLRNFLGSQIYSTPVNP
jgi:hypothetical protein